GIVVNDEGRRDPDLLTVGAEPPGTHRVERADVEVAGVVTEFASGPFAHFPGGLMRERDGEDPPGRDALCADEVSNAMSDDPGLAAPGPGEDEHGPAGVFDRCALLVVEQRKGFRRRFWGHSIECSIGSLILSISSS